MALCCQNTVSLKKLPKGDEKIDSSITQPASQPSSHFPILLPPSLSLFGLIKNFRITFRSCLLLCARRHHNNIMHLFSVTAPLTTTKIFFCLLFGHKKCLSVIGNELNCILRSTQKYQQFPGGALSLYFAAQFLLYSKSLGFKHTVQ